MPTKTKHHTLLIVIFSLALFGAPAHALVSILAATPLLVTALAQEQPQEAGQPAPAPSVVPQTKVEVQIEEKSAPAAPAAAAAPATTTTTTTTQAIWYVQPMWLAIGGIALVVVLLLVGLAVRGGDASGRGTTIVRQ